MLERENAAQHHENMYVSSNSICQLPADSARISRYYTERHSGLPCMHHTVTHGGDAGSHVWYAWRPAGWLAESCPQMHVYRPVSQHVRNPASQYRRTHVPLHQSHALGRSLTSAQRPASPGPASGTHHPPQGCPPLGQADRRMLLRLAPLQADTSRRIHHSSPTSISPSNIYSSGKLTWLL